MADFDVAVLGAGIVGVSTALWLRMRGHAVVLVDPAVPGSGTSSGNACTIATYACLPVNDPSVLSGLPGLLFGGDSPLSVSWSHALRNPRWMLSFLANCRAGRSQAISEALARLLAHAEAGLMPLIEEAEAEDLILSRGQISVWSTEQGAEGAEAGLRRRAALGVAYRELTMGELRDMEPGLGLEARRAVHFHDARHVPDPLALVQRFHARFGALGGETLVARAVECRESAEGVRITLDDGREVGAGHAVIAAGAFSHRIRGGGAECMPLGTERGYHLMYSGEAHRVTRPVGWGEGGFYAVPTDLGLRLAGTVEIAAREAPVNAGRLDYLARRGREMFAGLPEPSSHWMGYRPTLPDSLPAIGRAPGGQRVIHAFGHQHLGLTLGGITGRIVADLVEGRAPNMALTAYDPARRFV
ncbi:NAD(P)/FAD-dependent oxidoreductase [Pseudooceanicola sp. C21-150M6]|uniref:NAD(P)/FAD-dependent oxidoreductase n=1 Tax=Pseudooceanicola sp. C21-150M6 TaxID=3434355 RepID=UPI003D7F4BE1